MEKNYRKLGYIFLIIIPLTIIGFYPSYFGLFPEFNKHIDALVHLHFCLSALWIAILITQPLLIVNKKYEWHKRIGRISLIIIGTSFVVKVPPFG